MEYEELPEYKIELEQKLKELDIYIPHYEDDFENIDCLSESLLYNFNEDEEEINTIIEYMICLLKQKIIKINKKNK